MNKKLLYKISLSVFALTLLAAGCNKTDTSNTAIQQATQISVSQSVQNGKNLEVISVKPEDHKTALDILKGSYEVKTKSFGDAGEFVETISSQTPDKNHFWSFYVNGKQSNVGAGSYEVKDTDSIEWKLEEIK